MGVNNRGRDKLAIAPSCKAQKGRGITVFTDLGWALVHSKPVYPSIRNYQLVVPVQEVDVNDQI